MRRTGWRLAALTVVILGLAPSTWLRTHVPPPEEIAAVAIRALPIGIAEAGELRLVGQWELSSPSVDFGGFSALLPRPDGSFLALSDLGMALAFPHPDQASAGRLPARLAPAGERRYVKSAADIEAAAQSSDGNMLWLAFEGSNRVQRSNASWGEARSVRPPAMQHWPANSGAEAMARLEDGRFIVIGEGMSWSEPSVPALLFAGDPVEGGESAEFRFTPPGGYRPSDMALLPDSRALILLRGVELALPPRFTSRLVLADPATIEAGGDWQWHELPRFPEGMVRENYEGLTVLPRAAGGFTLWLISDDNRAAFQRTMLVELEWVPEKQTAGEDKP